MPSASPGAAGSGPVGTLGPALGVSQGWDPPGTPRCPPRDAFRGGGGGVCRWYFGCWGPSQAKGGCWVSSRCPTTLPGLRGLMATWVRGRWRAPLPGHPPGGVWNELGDAGALALCQRGGGDAWVTDGSGGTGSAFTRGSRGRGKATAWIHSASPGPCHVPWLSPDAGVDVGCRISPPWGTPWRWGWVRASLGGEAGTHGCTTAGLGVGAGSVPG